MPSSTISSIDEASRFIASNQIAGWDFSPALEGRIVGVHDGPHARPAVEDAAEQLEPPPRRVRCGGGRCGQPAIWLDAMKREASVMEEMVEDGMTCSSRQI